MKTVRAQLALVVFASIKLLGQPPSGAPAAGDAMGDLATKLNNPAASLISVPIQSNFDFGGGPNDDGFQYRLNVQPVIPIDLNEDWKLLTRTIVPFISQHDRVNTGSQSGLGDTTVTLWVSPQKEKPGAPIWGLGPILQLPTATDDLLGSEKWGIGPSALLVHQENGVTVGALLNHLWSIAGESSRADISATFLQPFVAYQTPKHTTYGANLESSYDWKGGEWTIPLNLQVTQLVKISGKPVSFQVGYRYYLDKPDGGPDWGLRFNITLVFPK